MPLDLGKVSNMPQDVKSFGIDSFPLDAKESRSLLKKTGVFIDFSMRTPSNAFHFSRSFSHSLLGISW